MLGSLLDKMLNRPLTEDRFAQLFIESARGAGYRDNLDYQANEFRLRHNDGGYFNLHNAFRDYQGGEKSLKPEILKRYVATLIQSTQKSTIEFVQARPLLRPVIRSLAMLEEVRLENLRTDLVAPAEAAYQTLGKDCVVFLALDSPESTATLTKGPEPQWGITLGEALLIANDNLRDETPDAFAEVIPGLYVGHWADGYDSSRALLPDVLQRAPIKGNAVFMIPTRDVLLVTGDRDEEGIRQMVEACFSAFGNGRAVSSQIYTYDDRQIVPFTPSEEVARQRLVTLEHVLLQGNYHSQKEILDRIHEGSGEDVFVASFMLFELPGSNVQTVSMCSWTLGIVSLLPKTDRIALVEPLANGKSFTKVVRWDDLEALCGDLMALDNLYPPRYRTAGFPSAQQVSQLASIQ